MAVMSRSTCISRADVYLCLMRHGQSRWNARNRFTGWTDVRLTPQGEKEAFAAGRLLAATRIQFSNAFTSELSRAKRTTSLVLQSMNQRPQVETSWRLNERHYGALTGMHKTETMELLGAEETMAMRRGTKAPPDLSPCHPMWRYIMHLPDMPLAESLPACRERTWRYWRHSILPKLQELLHQPRVGPPTGVLVVSHMHTIRLLVAELDGISGDELRNLDIPTAVPLLYEIDQNRLDFHAPLSMKGGNARVSLVKGKWLGETKLTAMPVSAVRSLLLRRRGLLYELLPHLPEKIQDIFHLEFHVDDHLSTQRQVEEIKNLFRTRPWIDQVDERVCDACARALHAVADDDDAPPRRKYTGLRSGWAAEQSASRTPARAAARRLFDHDAVIPPGGGTPVSPHAFPSFVRLVAVAAYLAWIQTNGAEFLPPKEYSFAKDIAKKGLLSDDEIKADLEPLLDHHVDHHLLKAHVAA